MNKILFYILNTALFIVSVAVLFAIYLFGIPLVVSPSDLNLCYVLLLTIVNVTAILLSWYYFKRTHCIEDEANPIAGAKYRWFGIDLTHLIFYCIRVIINVYFGWLLFNLFTIVVIFGTPVLLSHTFVVFGASFFTVELVFNLVAIIRSHKDECPKERPKICDLFPHLCPPENFSYR